MKDPFMKEFEGLDTTEMLRTALSFLAVNLPWIFFAIWLLSGPVPVLVLAVVINHMINRLEVRQLRAAYALD
ncbi:hypothetical protein TRM7557_01119 [Tritonibacter multivorans]|uniref:Uncharacterized protein n=1 Tax=Tritonibacter multivorans TaxID=928856 RepID=A0A0P1GM55_9RHOB|nr:hypothetical protein [Tritonibacter multivorans]MDA7421776.1 hypothetical protein [Tritonibacter multivorans]CUH76900.1 hypothetical protein TRM7557_01119 [Tritonibacter multivorans]SFD05199.1 hypothetical protein SAMN04488049_10689 [Tritonibacter multivorans]